MEWFKAAVQRVLDTDLDFVAEFDFRSELPQPPFAEALTRVLKAYGTRWSKHLKRVALLTEENILRVAAEEPIGQIVEACAPDCPLVICHGKAAAEAFLTSGRDTGTPFVSVVEVLDKPQGKANRLCQIERLPETSLSELNSESFCLASLKLSQTGRPGRPSVQAFHTMPNGDVCVIQSPPLDCMISLEPDSPMGGMSSDRFLNASAEELGRPYAALKFRCPRERLAQLIGAHFHVGELMIDAEMDSITRQTSKSSSADSSQHRSLQGCLKGIHMVFSRALHQVLALADKHKKPKIC